MKLEAIFDRQDVPADVKEAIKSYLINQKQLKETQQELGQQLRQTLDSMGDAIHVVDTDLCFILFNKVFKKWNTELGLKEDVIGQRINDIFPFLSDKTIDEYNQVFSTGKTLITEECTSIRDEEFITESRKIPIFEEGIVTRVVTVIKNITESRLSMVALKESEEKYRNLVDRANDGIGIVQDSLIKYVNPSLAKLTGYPAEELYNTPIMDYIHPDVLSEVVTRYERRMAGQSVPQIYETILLLKNNKTMEVEVNAGVITYQGKPADLAIIRDISERKRVEKALRESETRYRTILENIEDGYYEVDLMGNLTFFNDAMCRIHGYSKDELLGMNNREYTDEETADMVYKTFNRVYQTGESAKIFSYDIIRKDGARRVNEASVSLITNSAGEPTGFRGIVRDITERRQVEQALRESETRYRRLIDLSPDAIIMTDLEFNIVAVNQQAVRLNGANIAEELIGKNGLEMIAPEDRQRAIENAQKTLQGEMLIGSEYKLLRQDGTVFPGELNAALITDEKGAPFAFISILRDITERKIAEMELQAKSNAMDSSINAINITDLEGKLTYVNTSFLDMWDFSNKSEVVDRSVTEFTVNPELFFNMRDLLLREGSWMGEMIAKKRDGSLFPIQISFSLIISESGEPHSILASMIDITERKKTQEALKESEQKFRILSEQTMMGVSILQDEVIKYANQAFADIFEYSIEEILNWKPGESAKVVHPDDRSFVMEQGRRKQLGEKDIVANYTYRVVTRTGKIKWVDIYSKTIFYIGKTADLVSLVDVTERKQAEEELRESKEKYQMLIEKMQEGVILEDSKGFFTFVNPKTLELLGYTEEELLGKHWSYTVPEEYIDQVNVEAAKRPKGISNTYEACALAKDGRHIPVIITATPIFSTTGDLDGVLSVFTDITERKLAEKKIQESAEKYRTILETIEEGYYEVDLSGNFTFFNDSICRFLGYSRDELMGMNNRHYMDEDTAKMVYQTYNTVFQTKEPATLFDFEVIRKDGIKISNEASVSLIVDSTGEGIGFRGIIRDTTERTEMEKALSEEREKYQMLVEKLEEGLTLEDTEGFITFANPKTLETLGYTEEELMGKHWSFIVPENDLEESHIETAKRAKGISSIYESTLKAKDGTIIPVIVTATPIFSSAGEFERVLVLSTDITERKRIEEELKQSEEKYSNLFQYSNDAIFLHDSDGNIIDINQKTLDLFEYTKSETLSRKIPSLHPPEMLATSEKAFEKISKDGFVNFEINFIKKNGEVFPADVSSSLFTIGGKPVVQGIVRDITERKQAEKALQQVKLEEERYHAMMSHFVNNDLQKVVNNLELLSLMYESNLELDTNIVNRIINIASGSSKTIDTVNKIFSVLQSPFIQPEDSLKILDVINDVVSELPAFSQLVNADKETLDVLIFGDNYLKDVFTELLLFILSSFSIGTETSIDIKGFFLPSYFCVVITDCCSEPFSQEIISKLSGKITDKWEIIGHNIGIALTSVIMQYFDGSLKIQPSSPEGNVFELHFPIKMIDSEKD
ncbi:MAG: PAS domain S-box protein [Candidatus Hodarchaeales archaeon]|jgi:PAS domain S-box-containing protein